MERRLLDIIIPHYNEPYSVVRPLIEGLKCQRDVDWSKVGIFLIHNGDFEPTPMEWSLYENGPARISQVRIASGGVSKARNFGMDRAGATWVMFCDCDDTFTNIFALRDILHILGLQEVQDRFDLMWGKFFMTGNGKTIIADKMSPVFIHNKFYKLDFLREHSLRFCEKLRMSEDSAFNFILFMEMDQNRIGRINTDMPLYAWCRRPGSVTMDFSRWLENTEGHFERNLYVLGELRRRGMDSHMMVGRTVTDVYSQLSKKGIQGDPRPMIWKIHDFYQENKADFEACTDEELADALVASDKDFCIKEEDKKERMPFQEWVWNYCL